MALTNLIPPPPDKSGGYMQIKYSNGVYTHRLRLHVQGFQTALSSGGTNSNVPQGDYPYNTPPGTGGETGVGDTFAAFMAVVKPFFTSDWIFTVDTLVQNFNQALTPIFPTPTPAPVAGTDGGQNSGITYVPEGMIVFNMRTANGGRARVNLIGTANWQANPPRTEAAGAANDSFSSLVGYLTGGTTRAQGHDGSAIIGSAHVTFPYNRRLRRRYGQA